jgi:iron complex outermembrane receptor protein
MMTMSRCLSGKFRAAGLGVAILASGVPGVVLADAVGPVEEITVTARKRAESLQNVPISVSAITAETIRQTGAQSDNDIANLTVNFNTLVQTGRDADRPTIRGMGNPPNRGEANASYFIDGVYVSTSIAATTTSGIERVEVLRGPQSAQFGRATFSGAVNYVTRRPTDEFQGEINTRAGTHDDYLLAGWMSGPLTDDGRLGFLLSGSFTKYGGEWHNALRPGPVPPGTPESELPYYAHQTFPYGIGPNLPTDGDRSRLGGEETVDFMGKLVFRPTDASEINIKYSYTEADDQHFSNLVATDLNCYVPTAETVGEPWHNTSQGQYCGKWDPKGRVNAINLPDFRQGVTMFGVPDPDNPGSITVPPSEPGTRRETHRVLAEYIQELGDYTLTVRGGYNTDDFVQVFDLDHTGGRPVWGLFHFDYRRDVEDKSIEVRLDGPDDARLRPYVGLYWYDQDRTIKQRSYPGPNVQLADLHPANGWPVPTQLDIKNQAVFGGVDIELSDTWTLVLEGRWARDEKDLSGGSFATKPPPGEPSVLPSGIGLEFDNFTPRAILRWQPDGDHMYYFSLAKGNKPGDFNNEFYRAGIVAEAVLASINGCNPEILPLVVDPCLPESQGIVKEEEQWTWEVGSKLTLLDGRWVSNLAAFYIDWKNQGLFSIVNIMQDSGTYLTTSILRNVGRSEVKGLELENTFAITDNLTLVANYGLSLSRYKEAMDPGQEETTGDGDISGHYVPSVPKHSAVLALNATAPLAGGYEFFFSPSFSFESRRYVGPTNLAWLGNRRLVNLRAGVQAERWTLTGYVRNLMDDDTPLAALDFVNFDVTLPNGKNARMHSLSPQRGRDYGVELQYRFGNRSY